MTGAQRPRVLLCLAIVYLVWGSSYLATRIGVTHLPPLLFGGIRFVVAGLLLLAFSFWRGLSLRALLAPWRPILILGLLGVTFVNGLQVWALQTLSSQSGALLNASCAFWIVAFGLFGRRAHRPGARVLSGVVIGFAGTALLVWPQQAGGATPVLPQLAVLAACVFWAIATIYLRNVPLPLDVVSLTGAQMLTGGSVMVAGGWVLGEAGRWHTSLPGLASLAWLTLFSGCLAYTAYAWLARNVAPAVVGTYGYVNPLIATLLGYLVLGERLTVLQGVGSGVILVGVLLINWPARGSIGPFSGDP